MEKRVTATGEKRMYTGKRGRRLISVGLVFFAALLYFASSPVNRTEAEDAYEYAWRLENESGLALLDAHHLLYLPLAKIISIGTDAFLPLLRSLAVLSLISSVAAALTLYFIY